MYVKIFGYYYNLDAIYKYYPGNNTITLYFTAIDKEFREESVFIGREHDQELYDYVNNYLTNKFSGYGKEVR